MTRRGLPLKTYLRLRRAMKGTPPVWDIKPPGGRPTLWQRKKKKQKGDANEFAQALEQAEQHEKK